MAVDSKDSVDEDCNMICGFIMRDVHACAHAVLQVVNVSVAEYLRACASLCEGLGLGACERVAGPMQLRAFTISAHIY